MSIPKISISLPVYNEEKYIKLCLDSVERLDYPKNKIEVFVVDAGSTDDTVKIAKKYSFVKIIKNPKKDTHIAKMLGLRAAIGKYWTYFDADLQVDGEDWAKAMIKPLEEDSEMTASVSRYNAHSGDSPIEHYINLDPVGRDTLFAWFTPSVESTIVNKREGYFECKYEVGRIPPEGRCLFRTNLLKKTVGKFDRFRELDTLLLLTKSGNSKYAYVPKPGYWHRHPQTLQDLRRKRMRNTTKNYIPGNIDGYIKYTWFDLSKIRDLIKMLLLIAYSFSVVGPFLGGLYKTVKHKNIYGMVEFVYVPVAVEAYLEAFIKSSGGRTFLTTQLQRFLNTKVL